MTTPQGYECALENKNREIEQLRAENERLKKALYAAVEDLAFNHILKDGFRP